MHKGRLAPEGSTATAYAWLIWIKGPRAEWSTRLRWIAPCRKKLERPGDYPEAVKDRLTTEPLSDAQQLGAPA
jgi:hypothetical protein